MKALTYSFNKGEHHDPTLGSQLKLGQDKWGVHLH